VAKAAPKRKVAKVSMSPAKEREIAAIAKQKCALKTAKADHVEAKKKSAACKKAVANTQKACVGNFPNAKAAGAAYRGAAGAHVRAVKAVTAAAARVERLS